jgi:hypothetical protein
MALKEAIYDIIEIEPIPHREQTRYTPDELLERMAQASYEYHHAAQQMATLFQQKQTYETVITGLVQSKQWELLQDPQAKELCRLAFADPKFKPTVDFTNSVVYMEAKAVMEPFNYWEAQANTAGKYHQMLTNQLMWHQSENSRLKAEMMSLNGQT